MKATEQSFPVMPFVFQFIVSKIFTKPVQFSLKHTNPSGHSAVLQSSNNHHSVNSVLQFCSLLCSTICVAHLGNKDV